MTTGFRIRLVAAAVVAIALFTMRPALACTYELCERQCWEAKEQSYQRWYVAEYSKCLRVYPNEYAYCAQYAEERASNFSYTEYMACRQGCEATYGVPDELPDIGGCIPGSGCEEE